jgi:hypothetical protein
MMKPLSVRELLMVLDMLGIPVRAEDAGEDIPLTLLHVPPVPELGIREARTFTDDEMNASSGYRLCFIAR